MATLSRADAIAIVKERAAADVAPTLDDPQLGQIVDRAARRDPDGHQPEFAPEGDTGWEPSDWNPTYDLNVACAAAWELKAALTATTKFDIGIDQQRLDRSQIYDHCMEQARMYRARVVGTLPKAPPERRRAHF